MGKLIYGFNVSVDGYIADAQGNIDWSDPSEELHQYWNDFERETALSFYGRRLYELMSAYWPTADKTPDATPLIVDFAHIWRDMPKVVFSRTLESVDWNSRLERGDPVEVVTKLKAETDGRLEVAGATLAAPIVQAGLVDEYRIVVTPTAVGGGTPFFPTLPSWISARAASFRPEVDIGGVRTRVLAEQAAAVDPGRLGRSVGLLTFDEMRRVGAALRIVLDL